MKETLLMIIMKAKGNIIMKMGITIQANLKMDLNVEKEFFIIKMEILNTKEIL